MSNVSHLFKQAPHPESVDDFYHVFNSSNALNVVYWWDFFRKIQEVKGDIVECGVGRGRSLITLSAINKLISQKEGVDERRIFALDSFDGFPEPNVKDASPRNPKKGEWSNSPNNQFSYSPDSISKVLKCADIHSDITYIKGFFDKTTLNLPTAEIAILHLDGDLYESIIDPLNNLWKQVTVGGIIVIDDYLFDSDDNEAFPGARLAVMEFLAKNNSFEYLQSIRGTPYLIRQK